MFCGSAAARSLCQSVVFHNFHPTKAKRRSNNEEIPIYICRPCYGAQPVRRHGARSAKAATALTVTPSGNFVGGVDGSGVAGVDAVGTVTSITDGTVAVVNVTRAGTGTFGATPQCQRSSG